MTNLQEQLKRFNAIEKKLERDRKEYVNLEARFDIQKEKYREKKEELSEKGITFKNGKELQSIYEEKKNRVEDMLDEMEKALGLQSDEEDEDDFELV